MENELDEEGRRLLAYLVGKLDAAIPNDPRTFVSYKQVHDELGLPLQGTYGTSLERQGLVSLAEWTFAGGRPGITGLIIDREKNVPGPGYFRLFGRKNEDFGWWAGEVAKSKAYDWTPHLGIVPQLVKPARAPVSVESPATRSLDGANVWRLVAHHEAPEQAAELMVDRNLLAVGWAGTGDLHKLQPANASEISRLIPKNHPDAANAQLGGPSLWNLYREMKPGDLVILTAHSRRLCVLEVVGDYYFGEEDGLMGYPHQRTAALTPINADELWDAVGADVAKGQNVRWTLARCTPTEGGGRASYTEGERYEVRSTAIERNPAARRKCLEHYGYCCAACTFDFEAEFGEIGQGYIHVHHRHDLALRSGPGCVDPINDLVPLCPNCHAMVHRTSPAMDIDELIRKRSERKRSVIPIVAGG